MSKQHRAPRNFDPKRLAQVLLAIIFIILALAVLLASKSNSKHIITHTHGLPSNGPISTGATRTPLPRKPSTAPANTHTTYIVKPGDNLSLIAARFKIKDLNAFYKANLGTVGSNWNLIKPGQVLKLTIGM